MLLPLFCVFCSLGPCFVMQYLMSFSSFAILLVRMRKLVALFYVPAVMWLLRFLSYDVASGSDIRPCNKIDKSLVVYQFTGNDMQ